MGLLKWIAKWWKNDTIDRNEERDKFFAEPFKGQIRKKKCDYIHTTDLFKKQVDSCNHIWEKQSGAMNRGGGKFEQRLICKKCGKVTYHIS
ncbi:MAG: hypothetical protein KKA62_06030 [Nanoarchaeota archaeon]|nr:hypothetical protein [Nanoarchaeota archaeon]MBU1643808.1 hypothetical protein [Nanoarchaeota archaeon]MBU1977483.1 hypothetical protein [Nanoarchaeota archaeon]